MNNNNKSMAGKKLQAAASLFPELLSDTDRANLYKLENSNSKIVVKSSKVIVKEPEPVVYADDFNIIELMNSATDPLTGSFKDLKIDDRDLPFAKNFYDYSVNLVGKSISVPWARQMAVCLIGLGEVCSYCTKPKYFNLNNIPKDADVKDVKKALVLLEHGVCRKCKRTKHDLIKNFNLRNYQQIVLLFGQRCVTAETLILTQDGIEYIGNLAKGKGKGFSPYVKQIHNGKELETASDFYVTPKREYVHKIVLADGGSIKGTSDHPLLTSKGFKKLANITENDYVALAVGTNAWGTYLPLFSDAYTYSLDYVKTLPPGRHLRLTRIKRQEGVATKDWFTLLGLWVAEGHKGKITNWDSEVNTFLDKEFSLTFSKDDYINHNKKELSIRGIRGIKFLEYFVGSGMLNRRSATQFIPSCVLKAPKEYVCAFLKGLYEGDGGLEGRDLTYTTISIRLAHEMRVILLNLGIAVRLRIGMTWATNGTVKQVSKPKYTLIIAGAKDLQVFKDTVGFMTERKIKSLNLALDFENTRKVNAIFLRDKLPTHLNEDLQNFVAQCVAAVKEIPLPNCYNGITQNGSLKKKSIASIGKLTLLHKKPNYWKTENYVSPKVNHFKGAYEAMKRIGVDVDLNKVRLRVVLEQLDSFDAFLNAELIAYKNYLRTYLDDNTVWVKIAKIERNYKIAQTYDLTLPKTHRFVGNGIVNHNCGKSSITAFVSTYLTHCYLMFPNLASLARKEMQASTQLTGLFVSLTFAKAVGVMWTPYKKIIAESTWFAQHREMLDYHGAKYGAKFYTDSTIYLDYAYKNFRFYPSGPKFSTLRGSTSLFAALDELGLFPVPTGDSDEDETSERANADEAHKSLSRSLTTVSNIRNRLIKENINSVPACILMSVSSPISQRDKMMRLVRQSKTLEGEKYIYAQQMATWEINPSMNRDDPVISLAYSENFDKADRDYGANPPSVQSPFMRSPDLQDIFINGQNSHNLKYCYDKPNELYGTLEKVRGTKWPSLITIDAGVVNNSFCIIGGHYDFDSQKTVVTTIIECMPHENRRINFNLVYEHIIKVLAKDLHAIAMLADQWQSIDLLHRLKDDMGNNALQKPKVLSKQHSPNRKDFDVLLSMCRNRNLIFPTIPELDKEKVDSGNVENFRVDMLNKPVAHLYLQLLTMRDVGENKCPTKGDSMTDDIARALVLFASKLHTPIIMDRLKEAIPWVSESGKVIQKAMPMPGFRGRSG